MKEVIAINSLETEQLEQYIKRIAKLEQDKTALAEDIKEIFAEAKSNGFDVQAMRQILKLIKQDKDKLAELEAMVDLYRHALRV